MALSDAGVNSIRYLATACSSEKCIRSRPRIPPSGDRWTIASTSGLSPISHSDTPRSRRLFSASVNILSAVYSRSNTALRSSATTRGLAAATSGLIFSARRSALAKNIRPSGRRMSNPGKVSSSGCCPDRGRKTFVPGLRPSTWTAGFAVWYASATSDATMATTIPCKVPTSTTPTKATKAQRNSVRRIPRITRKSRVFTSLPTRVGRNGRLQLLKARGSARC